ncbi:MAG: glycosyltransferase [Kofleriaceae bacterium]|nr:glycosyltransferase [Kofleriaceae bacterium]
MLVSTIIPTYNRSQDVVVAVQSALDQTYPADLHEILVVDDGSTDDTAEVLARFGDRIRYVRKANGGVSAARNHGIDLARGEAIAFLDSDDTWAPEKIARQVALLQARPEIDLVLTSIVVVNPDGSEKERYSRRTTLPTDGHVLRYVLHNPAMTPSTAMCRTAVLREVGGFDATLRTAEDLDLHLRIALHHQVAVIDEPLVRYLRSDAGLSGSARTYHDYVLVMERFLAAHGHEIGEQDRKEALFAMYMRNARGLLHHGELGAAARLGAKSVPNLRHGGDLLVLGDLCLKFGRRVAVQAIRMLTAGVAL